MNLGHYPALLVFRTAAIAAVAFHREDVFLKLAKEPRWKDHASQVEPLPAFAALDGYAVLDHEVVRTFPRWNGNNRAWFPLSMLVEDDIRDVIQPLVGDQRSYREAFCRTEYRIGLLYGLDPVGWREATPGLYWSRDTGWNREGELIWEADFRANADRESWGWKPEPAEGEDAFGGVINDLTAKIKSARLSY